MILDFTSSIVVDKGRLLNVRRCWESNEGERMCSTIGWSWLSAGSEPCPRPDIEVFDVILIQMSERALSANCVYSSQIRQVFSLGVISPA